MKNPFPKPTKKERQLKDKRNKEALMEYREHQASLAAERDGALCVFCYFLHARVRRFEDVHHVYSRGKHAGDWREDYKNLLCTCRECHPPPIKIPGASKNLGWVEDVLHEANRNPINKKFKGSI